MRRNATARRRTRSRARRAPTSRGSAASAARNASKAPASLQAHPQRLEQCAAVVGLLQHARVGPDLRLGEPPPSVEDARPPSSRSCPSAACGRRPARANCCAAPSPTITSLVPGSNIRPSTMLQAARGSGRRLARRRAAARWRRVPVAAHRHVDDDVELRRRRSAGRPAAARTPGASAITGTTSCDRGRSSSRRSSRRAARWPRRREPESSSAARKPSRDRQHARRARATTPAMPTTATSDAPSARGRLRRFIAVIARTSDSWLTSAVAAPRRSAAASPDAPARPLRQRRRRSSARRPARPCAACSSKTGSELPYAGPQRGDRAARRGRGPAPPPIIVTSSDSASTSCSTCEAENPSVFSTASLAGALAHRLRHGVGGDQQHREEHRADDRQ